MKTEYVPPPYINRTLARHVRMGDPFSLTCSVTIDFGTMVELNWKTPNSKAIEDNRVSTPQSETKNLTMSGTHLKVVEQVEITWHVYDLMSIALSYINFLIFLFIQIFYSMNVSGNNCTQSHKR